MTWLQQYNPVIDWHTLSVTLATDESHATGGTCTSLLYLRLNQNDAHLKVLN